MKYLLRTEGFGVGSDLSKCVMYANESAGGDGWYEAILALPDKPSSVVRVFKTLRFPSNKKGEVTEEDFELLKRHGHIGEGKLLVVGSVPMKQIA
ncbi:MAG: hypothetical protein ACLPY5_09290 [Candidatus Bathyarchaeia archaeon]